MERAPENLTPAGPAGVELSGLAAIFLREAIRPVQVVDGAVILACAPLLRSGAWPGGSGLRSRRTAR